MTEILEKCSVQMMKNWAHLASFNKIQNTVVSLQEALGILLKLCGTCPSNLCAWKKQVHSYACGSAFS